MSSIHTNACIILGGGKNAFLFGFTSLSEDDPDASDNDDSSNVETITAGGMCRYHSSCSLRICTNVNLQKIFPFFSLSRIATVIVTAPGVSIPTGEASNGSKGGTNKAGVAAGAVVGVIALIALGVGAWLAIRRQRRLRAEEEYRAAVAAKEFVESAKKPSPDERLDPVILQQRRLSDGSIADNQDYSRRILKV